MNINGPCCSLRLLWTGSPLGAVGICIYVHEELSCNFSEVFRLLGGAGQEEGVEGVTTSHNSVGGV